MASHRDILAASPTEIADKKNLVAEIKFRAKSMISAKQYGYAGVLYGKAIDILIANDHKEQFNEDLAILYSNRSLTRAMTNQYKDAVDDADDAIECDESYTKAYWRLGTAYAGWERYEDAVDAYARGIKTLGGADDKKWVQEIQKCRSKAKEAPAKPRTRQSVTSSNSVSKSKSHTPQKYGKEDVEVVDESKLFSKSDAVRGYKVVDGKKTSYFHNEQSEEVKNLIGDIAPKRIESPSAVPLPSTNSTKSEASAWNKAGTWEEKDFTSYAEELLISTLSKVQYSISDVQAWSVHKELGGAIAKVSKVKDVNGHASIATVRGKRRYMYEFSLIIEFKINLSMDSDEVVCGSFKYPEIDGTTCCDDGEDLDFIDFKITSSDGEKYRKLADSFVRRGGLKDEIRKCICAWADAWHTSI